MKTYEFKYDKRMGGDFIEFTEEDGSKRKEKYEGFRLTSEKEEKKAELEADGYVEKTSDIIKAFRDVESKEEKEKIIENVAKSSTRAKNKYNAANYDRISVVVQKGEKEDIQAAAKECGYESVNKFITDAIRFYKDELTK